MAALDFVTRLDLLGEHVRYSESPYGKVRASSASVSKSNNVDVGLSKKNDGANGHQQQDSAKNSLKSAPPSSPSSSLLLQQRADRALLANGKAVNGSLLPPPSQYPQAYHNSHPLDSQHHPQPNIVGRAGGLQLQLNLSNIINSQYHFHHYQNPWSHSSHPHLPSQPLHPSYPHHPAQPSLHASSPASSSVPQRYDIISNPVRSASFPGAPDVAGGVGGFFGGGAPPAAAIDNVVDDDDGVVGEDGVGIHGRPRCIEGAMNKCSPGVLLLTLRSRAGLYRVTSASIPIDPLDVPPASGRFEGESVTEETVENELNDGGGCVICREEREITRILAANTSTSTSTTGNTNDEELVIVTHHSAKSISHVIKMKNSDNSSSGANNNSRSDAVSAALPGAQQKHCFAHEWPDHGASGRSHKRQSCQSQKSQKSQKREREHANKRSNMLRPNNVHALHHGVSHGVCHGVSHRGSYSLHGRANGEGYVYNYAYQVKRGRDGDGNDNNGNADDSSEEDDDDKDGHGDDDDEMKPCRHVALNYTLRSLEEEEDKHKGRCGDCCVIS